MLQVTDSGVTITLSGQSNHQGNGLFWFASALLIGAVAVAMAMSLLPERLAMTALAILVVGSFVFNWYRQKQQVNKDILISQGVLEVRPGVFHYTQAGQRKRLLIKETDQIILKSKQLLIYESNGRLACHVTGFDNAKEAQVMQHVLQGQRPNKRHVNIKMQSGEQHGQNQN